MKSTTMLSQITTQEDVLFAGITVKQLVVWMMGGVVVAIIYFIIPQPLKMNLSKGGLMLSIATTTLVSTIKRNGSLLLEIWLMRVAYLLRPTLITE
jgi:hypothetical protein